MGPYGAPGAVLLRGFALLPKSVAMNTDPAQIRHSRQLDVTLSRFVDLDQVVELCVSS